MTTPEFPPQPLGTQLIVEFYECDRQVLNDKDAISEIMLDAARSAQATVVNHCFHQFSPQGVSGVVVIAESHLTIHTWPEFGYCAVDIFTCGQNIDDQAAIIVLKEKLQCREERIFRFDRGLKNRSHDSIQATRELIVPKPPGSPA